MPTYIVLEETKRDEMWIEVGRRAERYEENNRLREDKELIWQCIRETSKKEKQGNDIEK